MAVQPHKQLLDDLTAQVEQLKVRFMLYFQGVERQNPVSDRDDLRKILEKARRDASRWNTADRFRMNAVFNKFNTYDRMWTRSLTEMENGTFRRDKERVKRKRKAEEEALKQAMGVKPGDDPAAAALAAAASRRVQAATAATGSGDMSDDRMRRLYNVYMQAKKRTGERSNISFESLKTQLSKQIPAIKKKHGCQSVDFKVVLKNGKAMLKAVPK